MPTNPQNSSFQSGSPAQRDDEGHAINPDKISEGAVNKGDVNTDETQSGTASGEDEDRHVHHGHGYVNAENQSRDNQQDGKSRAPYGTDAGYGGGDTNNGGTHLGDSRDTPSPYAGHERDGHKPDGGYLQSKPTVGKEPPMTPRSSRSGATESGGSQSLS